MSEFTPGLDLAEAFYHDEVRPIIDRRFPTLVHSAALLGKGSEVLGFDTERSTDHCWGPRLDIYLRKDDHDRLSDSLADHLAEELPVAFRGYPTNFVEVADEPGTLVMQPVEHPPVRHGVRTSTSADLVHRQLGLETDVEIGTLDWLTFPEQRLLGLVTGRVFHDGLGELAPLRERFSYYPHDVWLYLLAAQWQLIGQEEPFVARAGEAGDDLGSRILASRIVRYVMKLCFLIERQYAPYSKWFGTAFSQLDCAGLLAPHLERALGAASWPARETHLSAVYRVVAEMHNELEITAPLCADVSPFHDRPYLVIHAERFAAALSDAISDPLLRGLPYAVGAVDQWVDSTDVLTRPSRVRSLRSLYETE